MLSQEFSQEESANLIRELISFFTYIPKLEISLNLDKRISESELLKIHFGVKDLIKHRPLQYILGKASFDNLELDVNENVLIPRPETEELVNLIIRNNKTTNLNILDIGTGSGAIAIALKSHLKSNIFAVDISEYALKLAQQNADKAKVKINFVQCNILNKVHWKRIPNNLNIIVSNPPYVRNSERKYMQKNVLNYEPEIALFVDDNNPLVFYKAIAELSVQKLKNNGELWFEINEHLANELVILMQSYFKNIEIIKDFRGKNRFCKLKDISNT